MKGTTLLRRILLVLVVLFVANPAFAVRIKIATKTPENFKSARLVKQMTQEIEEKTDRNVRFKVYYGGVKGSGRDLLLKMKSGEIQGGEFTAGEASSVLNDLQILNMPLMFKNYEEVDFVLDRMRPHFRKELAKRDYVFLGWLEVGFGYIMSNDPIASRADLQGKKLVMSIGYSSPVEYEKPDTVNLEVNGTSITVSGADKQQVGLVAARIRSFYPPEPYKGKGIRYKGEHVRRKAGKTVA